MNIQNMNYTIWQTVVMFILKGIKDNNIKDLPQLLDWFIKISDELGGDDND